MTRRAPRARRLGSGALVLLVVFALASSLGLLAATNQQESNVERVTELSNVMADTGGPFVNYLLVGSDTREGADPNSPDYGGIGAAEDTGGRRSDTMMVLHVDNERDVASIMSIPRDLWVNVPGYGENRINTAYTHGADVLVRTVQEALGIPINHYIEVDFNSFKAIVGALGGVDICFDAPTRDVHTGLWVPMPGCYTLDPMQSLAYARSRYFETYRVDDWKVDGRADLGRIERQQTFVQAAVSKAQQQMTANPLRASDLINAAVASLRVDPGTDLVESIEYLRPLASSGVVRYSLPVVPAEIGGKSVLVLGADSAAILGYLAGSGEPPAPAE
ncbi:MAG: hypothetical protein RIU67_143 [Actinomycetota bacterium]